MKKSLWIISVSIIVILGLLAATPFFTISSIKTAVVERDSEKLSENIDFPVFRQNLKNQFSSAMAKNTPPEFRNSPFGAIAAGFATTMADGVVDSFVTPSGLTTLMKGKKPSRSRRRNTGSEVENSERDELFKNARYTYDSLNSFSVWVPTDTGDEIRFILHRDGIMSWKLVDMIVPI